MKAWSNIHYLQSFGHNYPLSLSRDSLYPFYTCCHAIRLADTPRYIQSFASRFNFQKQCAVLGFTSFNMHAAV